MNAILNLIADDRELITYRKELNKITGSVLATILLQQIMYWHKKADGEFYKFKEPCNSELYKEGDSWTEELGFTRREFDTALKSLKKEGLVVTRTNMNRQTFYDLDSVTLRKVTMRLYEKAECASTKRRNAPIDLLAETTTETTTENKKINKKNYTSIAKNSHTLSEREDVAEIYRKLEFQEAQEAFSEYLAFRKQKKLSNSKIVIERLNNKLEEFAGKGHKPIDVILNALTASWRDFYEPSNTNTQVSTKNSLKSFKQQDDEIAHNKIETSMNAIKNGFDPFNPDHFQEINND